MAYRPLAVLPLVDWSAAVRGRPRLGHTIEVHELIGSTNDRARDLLAEPGGDGSVVLAESQTAGRGRRGRSWISPPGLNLTLSVALRPSLQASEAWQLGLATALGTLEACDAYAPGASLGLKWPNDLVAHDGRKVAGLLIETMVGGESMSGGVLGIGINVNWRRSEMSDEIAELATSLSELAGADIDRVALLDRLLDELDAEILAVEAGRSPLSRYRSACVTLGQHVTLEIEGGPVSGTAVELDDDGSLVLDTATGRISVSTGEVTAAHAPDAVPA